MILSTPPVTLIFDRPQTTCLQHWLCKQFEMLKVVKSSEAVRPLYSVLDAARPRGSRATPVYNEEF